MAIRVAQVALTELRVTDGVTTSSVTIQKGNYLGPGGTAGGSMPGRVIGGQPGQIMGHWRAIFVRLPSSMTLNGGYVLLGRDTLNSGNFTGAADSVLRIYGNGSATDLRRKFTSRYGSSGIASTLTDFSNTVQLDNTGSGKGYLIIEGISNTGTNVSPVWRQWIGICKAEEGTATSQVILGAVVTSTYITTVDRGLLEQIFSATPGSGGTRTPVDTVLEHAALVMGDFPWDTVNDRPHHAAIEALAGVGSNPYLTYSQLISAQNSDSLPYSNCDYGKGNLEFYWTLANTSTSGLVNLGVMTTASTSTAGLLTSATLVLRPGSTLTNSLSGLATISDRLAPTHWYGAVPGINEPPNKFVGGRGSRPVVITGTYQVGTNGLQRRWTSNGIPLTGFDWAAVTSFNGNGTWSNSDILPEGGPYTFEVRDSIFNDLVTQSDNWMVGTVIVTHGQSGMERSFQMGASGSNDTQVTVSSNVRGRYVKLSNQTGFVEDTAGSFTPGATYVITALSSGGTPVNTDFTLIGAANNNIGTSFIATNNGSSNGNGKAMRYVRPSIVNKAFVPNTIQSDLGQGTILFANEWAANTSSPLLICNMAIAGTSMTNWGNDVPVEGNYFNWNFMGTVGNVAGNTTGNNSGVVETYASYLNRYADLHLIMWTPGMSSESTGSGSRQLYVQQIDARYNNSTSTPWAVVLPWRGAREATDTGLSISKREEHITFVSELGPRGYLGPCWPDIVSDGDNSLHSAFCLSYGVPSATLPVSDGNKVGQSRLGLGLSRISAWVFNPAIKAMGPRLLEAWYTDANRNSIQIELGRAVRTLSTASISNQFWISYNSGTSFTNTGFTVSLSADATRAILSTSTQFPVSGVRVDYCRNFPFPPSVLGPLNPNPSNEDEILAEGLLDGILYDNQTYRGRDNLAVPAGNPLQGTHRSGINIAGIPVETKGPAKLLATERWAGSRTVTVRLMSADGTTVLKEKMITITGSQ